MPRETSSDCHDKAPNGGDFCGDLLIEYKINEIAERTVFTTSTVDLSERIALGKQRYQPDMQQVVLVASVNVDQEMNRRRISEAFP